MAHALSDALRAAMRRWATGVTVVTAAHEGRRTGMTVSAFLSVSLEPPTVLVSLHEGADTLAAIRAAGAFAVSILPEGAEALSSRFAGSGLPPGADKFDGVTAATGETGAPVLVDSIAWIEARVLALHAVGTHVLVVGEVASAGVAERTEGPLLYYDRGYRRVAR